VDLDVLTEVIDSLHGSDPSACADTESIEILHRQLARLEAFVTNATSAFDSSENWVPDGARGPTTWLVARCRLPKARARAMVRRGRSLHLLPACSRAWAEGDLTAAQVDVMTDLRNERTEEALARDEAVLVEQASSLRYDLFGRVARYWKQLADPDGAEDDDLNRRGRRDVYLDRSFDGMYFGRITLDPISGSIVSGELERIEQAMFEADWAAARAALDDDHETCITDLVRSPGQRRADALVEMATRSQMAPSDGRRPTPLISILVDYGTLRGRVCELAEGTVIAPGSLLPWLNEAYLERVVFAPARRVEVSESARLFSGATRRAIQLRDRECTHPYCDVPAASCQVDHIIPFTAGGPTIEENGRLLCGFHNRLRNARPPPDD
jgi:Domain of unknown function (DUF222)